MKMSIDDYDDDNDDEKLQVYPCVRKPFFRPYRDIDLTCDDETARRVISYAVDVASRQCLSVCLSVCQSQSRSHRLSASSSSCYDARRPPWLRRPTAALL